MAPTTELPRLAIVADDLTGALDSGAAFARYGLRTLAVTSPEAIERVLAEECPEILTISTQTRDASPDEARRRVAQVVTTLPAGTPIFKKVDSRLKGPIAAELDEIPFHRLVAMPAIPLFDRVVRNGCVSGFGVDSPISVAAALGHHADRACIPDIAHDEDMDRWLDATDPDTLLLGARTLSERIARRMADHRNPEDAPLSFPPALCVVAGSRDVITLSQIDSLLAAHPDAVPILAPNGCLVAESVQSTRLMVLQAVSGPGSVAGETVAASLAASLTQLVEPGAVTLLLTGGATAEAVLQANGILVMELLGEILPGLPVCRAGDTIFITKSGGFGANDTLARVAEMVCTT
ncbi:four-carbon acid sugar kinase family protein [Halomonas sp. NO4]|uniref:four-carbon acid sugar kinase family protein n=1 Tax=Halomonas sp. NO4 TaxID=2484813 RepID=UPI0013D60E95|nr:four-carbon acid sugar kinase family protein [Halomonas sp. NO4]